MQFYSFSQRLFRFQGSSFVSPAYGRSGTRATINYNSPAAEKKSGEAQKQAGKKKKGCGENEFLPACQSAEGGQWGGSVSALPLVRGSQNRKFFFSLIEKKLGDRRFRKCRENFSVLLAEAERRRAETLGGIQSAKSSGFCSKWVRISSNKHHHNEFEECSASPSPAARASAGRFASRLKGFLKSISSRPAARRRFTNEIRIAQRAMSRFFLSPKAKGKTRFY